MSDREQDRARLVEVMARVIAPHAWRGPNARERGLMPRASDAESWAQHWVARNKPARDGSMAIAGAAIGAIRAYMDEKHGHADRYFREAFDNECDEALK